MAAAAARPSGSSGDCAYQGALECCPAQRSANTSYKLANSPRDRPPDEDWLSCLNIRYTSNPPSKRIAFKRIDLTSLIYYRDKTDFIVLFKCILPMFYF